MLKLGAELSGYRLTRVLQENTLHVLYEAEKPNYERVVIKVAASKAVAAIVGLEADLLQRFQCRSIVRCLGRGEHKGLPYLIMEYLQPLPGGPGVPAGEIADFVGHIAAGIDYCHAHGVLHRGVTFPHVRLRPATALHGNQAVLCGFTAALSQETVAFWQQNPFLGTFPYIAPELTTGQPWGPAADIYAFGVIVYAWLSNGHSPFYRDTLAGYQIECALGGGLPVALGRIVPSIDVSVERIVMQALAQDPAERFGTAGDFAQQLRVALVQQQQPVGIAVRKFTRVGALLFGTAATLLYPVGWPDVVNETLAYIALLAWLVWLIVRFRASQHKAAQQYGLMEQLFDFFSHIVPAGTCLVMAGVGGQSGLVAAIAITAVSLFDNVACVVHTLVSRRVCSTSPIKTGG